MDDEITCMYIGAHQSLFKRREIWSPYGTDNSNNNDFEKHNWKSSCSERKRKKEKWPRPTGLLCRGSLLQLFWVNQNILFQWLQKMSISVHQFTLLNTTTNPPVIVYTIPAQERLDLHFGRGHQGSKGLFQKTQIICMFNLNWGRRLGFLFWIAR